MDSLGAVCKKITGGPKHWVHSREKPIVSETSSGDWLLTQLSTLNRGGDVKDTVNGNL